MAIRLKCMETGKTAERDWTGGPMIGKVEYDAILTELGGEPTGDVVLVEVTPEA